MIEAQLGLIAILILITGFAIANRLDKVIELLERTKHE